MDTSNYYRELDSYTQNVIDMLVKEFGWDRIGALSKAALRDFDDMCADGFNYDTPYQHIVDRFRESYLSLNPRPNTRPNTREARKRAWEAARG